MDTTCKQGDSGRWREEGRLVASGPEEQPSSESPGCSLSHCVPRGSEPQYLVGRRLVDINCSSPAAGRPQPRCPSSPAKASGEPSPPPWLQGTSAHGHVRDQVGSWDFGPHSAAVTMETPWKLRGSLAFHPTSPSGDRHPTPAC